MSPIGGVTLRTDSSTSSLPASNLTGARAPQTQRAVSDTAPAAGASTAAAVQALETLAATAGLSAWVQSVPPQQGIFVRIVDPKTGHSLRRILPAVTEVSVSELRAEVNSVLDQWA